MKQQAQEALTILQGLSRHMIRQARISAEQEELEEIRNIEQPNFEEMWFTSQEELEKWKQEEINCWVEF